MNALVIADAVERAGGFLASFGMGGMLVVLLLFLFWLWMLENAITNSALHSKEKLIWSLIILFVPLIGAFVYYFLAHRPYRRSPLNTSRNKPH